MAKFVYADNAATTPVSREVVEAMTVCFETAWGNPSSQHGKGYEAKALVDDARARIARVYEARVKFLTDLGWEVTTSPAEATEVRIPRNDDQIFARYNELQKSQGYDLAKYAGKRVMRYVYRINNYPNAKEPVYATLLIYKDKIIGGDITDTTPGGKVQGFAPLS